MDSPIETGRDDATPASTRALRAVWLLAAGLALFTSFQAIERYHALKTGWSWDLAYYNQWFWSLLFGDGILSVRPISPFATEGPSVWAMNYLAPVRFLIVPIYWFLPDPRTLLVLNNLVFWLIVPASYSLVRSETGSNRIAFAATLLVPLTPLLWPLAWNDFREIQLGLPFVLIALQGWRSRSRRLTALGVLGMLACRQEFAVIVASLAILNPREPEDRRTAIRWSLAAIAIGAVWFCVGFLGVLSLAHGTESARLYLQQFDGPKPGPLKTLGTSIDFLLVGLGSWAVLAWFAPRVAILGIPWVWSVASGKWELRLIGSAGWHQVRYAGPFTALFLAAGLIGYGRLSAWMHGRGRRVAAALLWAIVLAGLIVSNMELQKRFARIPLEHPPEDVAAFWRNEREVGPTDGVLAHYDFTAPLSSRRFLYSDVLDKNRPEGYPILGDRIQWIFLRPGKVTPKRFDGQGFRTVYSGRTLVILRRGLAD
jgi:hypothetical protein